jgi:hypothetical protein
VLRFEWSALHEGDEVLVHLPQTAESAAIAGVVTSVEWDRRGNHVGIRISGQGGRSTILWPSRLTVHGLPRDPAERCWRCEGAGETDVETRRVAATGEAVT